MISFVSGTMTPEIQETEPTGFYDRKKGTPMTKPTTWMQYALNGNKINAIKELRNLVRKGNDGLSVLTLAA